MNLHTIKYNVFHSLGIWLFRSIIIIVVFSTIHEIVFAYECRTCVIALVITIMAWVLNLLVLRKHKIDGIISLSPNNIILKLNNSETVFNIKDINEIKIIYGGFKGLEYLPDMFVRGLRQKDGCKNFLEIRCGDSLTKIQFFIGSEVELKEIYGFIRMLAENGVKTFFVNNITGIKVFQRNESI